ncbi:11375_t:CDS:2 [Paraglomus occultum]|uniref:Phosphatidylglycerol/phosphatidylinositol transfer protein n=1 Tax=Paraglomus occultum TaxID=144539 RepID=A0A9N8W0J4_9GLOM|nr:11375_t:CDS:2 [Paraglomus occultum]
MSFKVINAIPYQFNKRTTGFIECGPIPGNPVDITALTVTVSPDPIGSNQDETFTISGTAKEDISTDAELSVTYNTIDGFVIGMPFFVKFCADGNTCPVKNGDEFTRTVIAKAPTLPTAYNVTIIVNDNTVNTGEVIFGCASATVSA